jgi:hypothetical protein
MGCSTSGKTLLPQEPADKYVMYIYILLSGESRSRHLQWTPYPFVLRKLRINRRPGKKSAQEGPDLTLFLSSRSENFSSPGRAESRPNTHAPTPARTARQRVR